MNNANKRQIAVRYFLLRDYTVGKKVLKSFQQVSETFKPRTSSQKAVQKQVDLCTCAYMYVFGNLRSGILTFFSRREGTPDTIT